MRLALVTLAVTGACMPVGTTHSVPPPSVATIPVPEFAASKWVPAHPTYMVLAKTVTAAQQTVRDVLDSLGLVAGFDADGVASMLAAALVIDPFNPGQVAENGVDLHGGFALFSEDIDPTFVVHLAAPEKLHAFFADQRAHGFTPRVVVVEGVEIATQALGHGFSISWAIDADWLWVHFTLPAIHDDGAWFAASRHASAPWLDDFAWARQVAHDPRGAVGLIDLHQLFARAAHVLFGDAPNNPVIACADQVLAVRRIGLASDSEGKHAALRVTVELSAGKGAELAREISPPTEGWANVTARAPLAAQWNFNAKTIAQAIAACVPALHVDLQAFPPFGVRAGRAVIASIDPAAGEGTGAVELDLVSTKFFADQLDRIPLRSHLESDAKFGPYAGKHLSIPFGPKLDYVLTDRVAMAGLGDGMLARAVGRGPGNGGPIAAIDILPAAMTTEAWRWLLEKIDAPKSPWLAAALQLWHDAHVTISLDRDLVIVDVHGDRR